MLRFHNFESTSLGKELFLRKFLRVALSRLLVLVSTAPTVLARGKLQSFSSVHGTAPESVSYAAEGDDYIEQGRWREIVTGI